MSDMDMKTAEEILSKRFLDRDVGLPELWKRIKQYFVIKSSDGGLSANNFTDALKTKLDGIEDGAEVNQNAFSNVDANGTAIQATSKTDTFKVIQGDNIKITGDVSTKSFTISADMKKITNVSELTNDKSYQTKTEVDSAISSAVNTAISSAVIYKGSVQTEGDLPKENVKMGDMYNIIAESSYGYEGINVAWNGSSWDPMGYTFHITATTEEEINNICDLSLEDSA